MIRGLLTSLIAAWFIQTALGAQTAVPSQQEGSREMSQAGIERINREVRHELLLLPYYGVFDNLGYRVAPDGGVTLVGQVARPTLKSDAANAVKQIEGVEHVDNQIQVLPTSGMDDRIRMATYRAIYGNTSLSTYGLRAVPPIHIIVNSGHVTLEGAVSTQMDKQTAEMQAKSVPNVFSVTNNLQVDQGK
jgi:hyperosmotically inducible periplasmic protein